MAPASRALELTLAWDANEEPDVDSYRLHMGTASRQYPSAFLLGKVTSYTVTDLVSGVYYFAVTARNTAGLESDFSNEVIATIGETRIDAGIANNRFEITAHGVPGQKYSIQISRDLKSWEPLISRTADSKGQFTFRDTAFPDSAFRFYRTVQQ
jgi:fibronectin type 3 domain-containing protein